MPQIKIRVLDLVNTKAITGFVALSGIAIFLPFFIHLQWITGPIINAVLIITLILVGTRSAIVLALVPSLMALSGGLLPAILAPVVPFIMISNLLFILIVDYFYQNFRNEKTSYWIGIVTGAGVKFLFLLLSVNFIGKLLIKQELVVKVAQMMSWPQFATAVVGGMIAWVVLKWLKR
jgi:hypothetical protein